MNFGFQGSHPKPILQYPAPRSIASAIHRERCEQGFCGAMLRFVPGRGTMLREIALKTMLVLVGLLFLAGIYPVTMDLWHANPKATGDE